MSATRSSFSSSIAWLVEQVGVVGELLVRLRHHLLGFGVHLAFAQKLGLGEQLRACVARRLLGDAADQFARFLDLALAREQRRPARLHLERTLRVVDAREPALGAGEVLLLLGGLAPGAGTPA
jgi:hypothetical protein